MHIGDSLQLYSGKKQVLTNLQTLDTLAKVYNFEVQDAHTYYVGNNSVLVHNSCSVYIKGLGEVANEVFHRQIKPEILSKAGSFSKFVGKNPDISVEKGMIVLSGTGPFKGKTFKTILNASDFFK